MRRPRTTAMVYAAVSALDALLASAESPGVKRIRRITKPALMPLLALDAHSHSQPLREVDVALAASWVGDVGLLNSSDAGFLVGVGGFAAAHASYLKALTAPVPDSGTKRATINTAAGAFSTAAISAGTLLWKRLSQTDPLLRVPVAAYAGLVSTMGFAAVRRGLLTGGGPGRCLIAGGILFTVSDGLVALTKFGPRRYAGLDTLVMATYTSAQALLVAGLRDATSDR
ncbi:putative membrane protein YhhN [Antricoccus suffuscus]|uniref:Putative membrane protein YhhN n=1 Tax=Antricoccus suffuscus TaxID=1629062 RepID=A0A2T1A4H7_9ACTN|nr:lysoplasmalogenase [Antricoccus suffuscus]PRZ43506.1 putative membrane protein YhhN [Antricoccus suffuscus]